MFFSLNLQKHVLILTKKTILKTSFLEKTKKKKIKLKK